MNEKLKIVQSMQRIAQTIEDIELELEEMEKLSVKQIDRVILEYSVPVNETNGNITTRCKTGSITFKTPNGQDAQRFFDYIKRAYELRLAEYYKALDNYSEMLKNAPSGAATPTQGNV